MRGGSATGDDGGRWRDSALAFRVVTHGILLLDGFEEHATAVGERVSGFILRDRWPTARKRPARRSVAGRYSDAAKSSDQAGSRTHCWSPALAGSPPSDSHLWKRTKERQRTSSPGNRVLWGSIERVDRRARARVHEDQSNTVAHALFARPMYRLAPEKPALRRSSSRRVLRSLTSCQLRLSLRYRTLRRTFHSHARRAERPVSLSRRKSAEASATSSHSPRLT